MEHSHDLAPPTGGATSSSSTTPNTSVPSSTGPGLLSTATSLNTPSLLANASGTGVAGGLVGQSSLAIPSTTANPSGTGGSSDLEQALKKELDSSTPEQRALVSQYCKQIIDRWKAQGRLRADFPDDLNALLALMQ